MKKRMLLALWCITVVLVLPGTVLADKSSVSIEAPATATRGSDAVIKLTVTHSGNSFLHYTDWVRLDGNGKTVAKWEYTRSNRPEAATFTKEIKINVVTTMELLAEANCNLHGSAGPAKTIIRVQE